MNAITPGRWRRLLIRIPPLPLRFLVQQVLFFLFFLIDCHSRATSSGKANRLAPDHQTGRDKIACQVDPNIGYIVAGRKCFLAIFSLKL
jgi:hypothetical protein